MFRFERKLLVARIVALILIVADIMLCEKLQKMNFRIPDPVFFVVGKQNGQLTNLFNRPTARHKREEQYISAPFCHFDKNRKAG